MLPNEERRIEIAYSVAGAIENGTTVELQAAVASFELPCIGSNVVRLVARSKPQLANALTGIAIEAARDAVPGSQAQVTIRIHNAGESTARDVVETPSLRSTLERLVREAGGARGVPAESPTAALSLRGTFDPRELRELGERFAQAQLATALPWAALARLLPDETPACADYRALLIEVLDGYEDSDCNEFIDALQHRYDSRLEGALDAMTASLHAMA